MTTQVVVQIGRELLITTILLGMPTIVISLSVGLLVSVLQTITGIQEQTLNFAPRIIAVGVVLIFTLPWMLQVLVHFTERMLWQLAGAGQ